MCQSYCVSGPVYREILSLLLGVETSAEMLQYLHESFKVLNNTAN